MSSTFTPNVNLRKPEHADPETYYNWDIVINDNMDTLDAFLGPKSYSAQNYIQNGDPICQSLNSLDLGLKVVADLSPTSDEKGALVGAGTPTAANPFVTLNYLVNAKKDILFPVFVQAATPAVGNTGTMTTNSEVVAYYRFNYYQWVSAETGALNSYDLIFQWKVPSNFIAFSATTYTALQIDFKTEVNDSSESKVDVELQKDGVVTTSTSNSHSSDDAWLANRLGNAAIRFDKSDPVLSALVGGDILNIRLTLSSKDSNYVRIGAITFRYTGF